MRTFRDDARAHLYVLTREPSPRECSPVAPSSSSSNTCMHINKPNRKCTHRYTHSHRHAHKHQTNVRTYAVVSTQERRRCRRRGRAIVTHAFTHALTSMGIAGSSPLLKRVHNLRHAKKVACACVRVQLTYTHDLASVLRAGARVAVLSQKHAHKVA